MSSGGYRSMHRCIGSLVDELIVSRILHKNDAVLILINHTQVIFNSNSLNFLILFLEKLTEKYLAAIWDTVDMNYLNWVNIVLDHMKSNISFETVTIGEI